MPNLSSPIGELRSHYGVLIIGSGYGGGAAALRIVERLEQRRRQNPEAPQPAVCVLERGREWNAGDFPSSLFGALRELQVDAPRWRLGRHAGLFDFRSNPDMNVLVGCGLGGTSLINAGVISPPLGEVLTGPRWPSRIRRHPGAVTGRFNRVRHTLAAAPSPPDVFPLKMQRLFEAGEAATHLRPPIAVTFTGGLNRQNIPQRRCAMCGDCVTGCNHGAKNTVNMNYLAAAKTGGADIFCGVEVGSIERVGERTGRTGEQSSAGGWLVHVRLVDHAWRAFSSPELTIRADAVFLAAGTLGSTELLLRSRDRHQLPLSSQLGQHFSGNGDVIAFSYDGAERANAFHWREAHHFRAMKEQLTRTAAAGVHGEMRDGLAEQLIDGFARCVVGNVERVDEDNLADVARGGGGSDVAG